MNIGSEYTVAPMKKFCQIAAAKWVSADVGVEVGDEQIPSVIDTDLDFVKSPVCCRQWAAEHRWEKNTSARTPVEQSWKLLRREAGVFRKEWGKTPEFCEEPTRRWNGCKYSPVAEDMILRRKELVGMAPEYILYDETPGSYGRKIRKKLEWMGLL